jgi:hypothetical protein
MISQALDIIKGELDGYLFDNGTTPLTADIGNIGEIITGNENTQKHIIISLVNVEENRISRDPRNFVKVDTDVFVKNPAVHLNLTMLFTAVGSYGTSLQHLQGVIEFFQKKSVFDQSNTANLDIRIEKLMLEMVSLNLEQLNHLWAVMGGRYQPSVVYKMRMITIDSVSRTKAGVVKEIDTNYFKIDP